MGSWREEDDLVFLVSPEELVKNEINQSATLDCGVMDTVSGSGIYGNGRSGNRMVPEDNKRKSNGEQGTGHITKQLITSWERREYIIQRQGVLKHISGFLDCASRLG